MDKTKSFEIPKQLVWEAWKQVKTNGGAGGVDNKSIAEYEENLKDNLYKLWNRMSSGSYMPKPVRKVVIPKSDGGQRELGIPTIEDRIAQTAAKLHLEPKIDSYLHKDMYGYREGKSAHDAIAITRERCWRYDWVLDIDIKAFFTSIDRELLMRAVRKHTETKWVLLYIERWLKAPVQNQDGSITETKSGTHQGSPISPVLANLYFHYAVVVWLGKEFPDVPFAIYADDMVAHTKTQAQAHRVMEGLNKRLQQCGLLLHPEKTKIVYCKDSKRRLESKHISFDFLGYTFRPRKSKTKQGRLFINFSPAISSKAAIRIRQTLRKWKIQQRSDKSIEDLANMLNPLIRGWINYYGKFYKSALYPIFEHLNQRLGKWATRKFKSCKKSPKKGHLLVSRIANQDPKLFAHWKFGIIPMAEQ